MSFTGVSNFILRAALVVAVFFCIDSNGALAADDKEAPVGQNKVAKSDFPYRRLDFQVKASCVSCLRRVAKALKSTRGVVSADVAIYYPHWAVVVLDTSMTDEMKVIARVKKEKADIEKLFKQDLKEKPLIVVPRTDKPERL